MLIFKAYLGDKMEFEEWHYFSNLSDLYYYAVARLKFLGDKNSYDRYDIQVKLTSADNMPLAS